MRNKSNVFSVIFSTVIILLSSCVNTKNAVYFNGIADTTLTTTGPIAESFIQKNDILQISISSLSPQASQVFNVSAPSPSGSASSPIGGYLVSAEGVIKLPMLGNIKAEGLTKKALEDEIAAMLVSKKLLFDPIVSVRNQNFKVTVLGEVSRPGVIPVPAEQITLLEAIGQAGDITVFGKRDNVLLIRQEGGVKTVKRLNLNSNNILSSPYYHLKSNDVVYVEAGKAKVASTSQSRQIIPMVLSGLSLFVIVIDRIIQ